MNDRLRTTLASAALVASLSIAGVANASGGDHEDRPRDKDRVCKKKQGKGYLVQGFFVEGALDQVAGADTKRWGDDRWSGTVVLEVTKGNRRGQRDIGLSSYEVKNVRVIGAAEGVLPDEGTRLELVGTQRKACAAAPTEPEPEHEHPKPKPPHPKPHHPKPPKPTDPVPTTPAPTTPAPTTPAPTTPAPTTPDPTATTLEYSHDDYDGDDEYDEYEDGDYEGEEAEDDEVEVATPVTDVKVRVVHFKVRKSGKR